MDGKQEKGKTGASIHYLTPEPDGSGNNGRDVMTNLSHRVGLVLHVDDTLGDERRADIEAAIKSASGVNKAHFTDHRPHLMMVEYDPAQISSTDILHNVNHQSVRAELIGPI